MICVTELSGYQGTGLNTVILLKNHKYILNKNITNKKAQTDAHFDMFIYVLYLHFIGHITSTLSWKAMGDMKKRWCQLEKRHIISDRNVVFIYVLYCIKGDIFVHKERC